MQSHPSQIDKSTLHNELTLRYREYFESKLAITLLHNSITLPVVNKISQAIIKLLTDNKEKMLANIRKNALKIQAELSEPYFGHFYPASTTLTDLEMYETMLTALQEPKHLSQTLQIHCIYSYRLADAVQALPIKLADSKNNRIKKNAANPSNQLGISRLGLFTKKIGSAEKKHVRGMDEIKIDENSEFYQFISANQIPFAAGPSGHTKSLMAGAVLYGKLNHEELQQYSLAIFAFLAAGGHHSYYEVAISTQLLGIQFDLHEQHLSLTDEVKNSVWYRQLIGEFPEFTDKETTYLSHKL